jgi:D-alanyl-D-alanine carboxypeptidase
LQEIVRALAALALSASMVTAGWGNLAPGADPLGTLVLVNKQHKMPAWQPLLVLPDIPPSKPAIAGNLYMRADAAAAMERMFAVALVQGHKLYGVSGYRAYSTQKAIYDRRVGEDGDAAKRYVAPPGNSEHNTGLVMDITGETSLVHGLTGTFGDTPEGQWVAQHCHEYGFVIRYPKGWERRTGYGYEPWHLRYLGEEHAAVLYDRQMTLEEYLDETAARAALDLGLAPTPTPVPAPQDTPAP